MSIRRRLLRSGLLRQPIARLLTREPGWSAMGRVRSSTQLLFSLLWRRRACGWVRRDRGRFLPSVIVCPSVHRRLTSSHAAASNLAPPSAYRLLLRSTLAPGAGVGWDICARAGRNRRPPDVVVAPSHRAPEDAAYRTRRSARHSAGGAAWLVEVPRCGESKLTGRPTAWSRASHGSAVGRTE